ncbi:MAG: DUF3794 domain-containing protein [Eubacteriales bacterium]|nr:DUF3794 domain-containing protein [Eubacteriales bacterium]
MALEEIRQSIETERIIGEERVQIPVRAEAIVPGAGRDAVVVLLEEARLTMGEVDVQTDRVVVDGSLSAQALYKLGEDGEAGALRANAALSRAIDLPGAAAGMSCLCEAGVEHVESSYENGHIVFQAVVGLHVRVLALEKTELITALNGEEGLELKQEPVSSMKISAESSAQAVLEGDARMPPVLDARTALMDWGTVRIDDASADLGGVKVSGAVLAEALVGSGVPGRPVALVKYSLPFAQLVELPDWLCERVEASAGLNRLSARLQQAEDGGTNLHFDAEVDVRVKALGEDSVSALADAYGVGGADLRCEYAPVSFCSGVEPISLRETVRTNMMLPEGAPSPGTVIALRVRPQIGQIDSAACGSRISGILETQALYLASGSGALCSAKEELPFAIDCPVALTDSDAIELETESADATALMNDRLEVSCALHVTGAHRSEKELRLLRSAAAEPVEKTPFSVVFYWPSREEELWEIGKRYRVPMQRLAELNASRCEGEPLVVRG